MFAHGLARCRLNERTRLRVPVSVDAQCMEVLPIRQLARWAAAIGGALSVAAVALLSLGPALGLPGWSSKPPGREGAPVQLPAALVQAAPSGAHGLRRPPALVSALGALPAGPRITVTAP